MTALAVNESPNAKRSDQSKRLSDLKSEAAQIRNDLKMKRITYEEAQARLSKLTRRHSTFFNRLLEI